MTTMKNITNFLLLLLGLMVTTSSISARIHDPTIIHDNNYEEPMNDEGNNISPYEVDDTHETEKEIYRQRRRGLFDLFGFFTSGRGGDGDNDGDTTVGNNLPWWYKEDLGTIVSDPPTTPPTSSPTNVTTESPLAERPQPFDNSLRVGFRPTSPPTLPPTIDPLTVTLDLPKLDENCTAVENTCDLDGTIGSSTDHKGIYVCRATTLVNFEQMWKTKDVQYKTKCINQIFILETDTCGKCDTASSSTTPTLIEDKSCSCPCVIEPSPIMGQFVTSAKKFDRTKSKKELYQDYNKIRGVQMIMPPEDFVECIPEHQVSMMLATDEIKCEENCHTMNGGEGIGVDDGPTV